MKNRRTLFRETLAGMFAVSRDQPFINVAAVFVTLLCFSWLAASTQPFVRWAAKQISASHPALVEFALVAGLFVALISGLMLRSRKLGPAPPQVNLLTPHARAGLIAMLSPLTFPKNVLAERVDQALAQLPSPATYQAAREVLIRDTNWGPLVVAVETHSERLRYCTLITTPASNDEFAKASDLIRALVPHSEVTLRAEFTKSPYDLAQTTATCHNAIDGMLDGAPADMHRAIEEGDIILDFTGGLASMTAAAVLAASGRKVALQYLKQERGETSRTAK